MPFTTKWDVRWTWVSMPPGMTVSRLRSYVAAVTAGSRRVMRDPAITTVVFRRIPPRPSRTVPARIVMVGAWARAMATAGSRASSMDGLRDDGSGTRPTYAAALPLSSSDEQNETARRARCSARSEEHTSELQSPCNLVCRLLLEKKKMQGQGLCNAVREQHDQVS